MARIKAGGRAGRISHSERTERDRGLGWAFLLRPGWETGGDGVVGVVRGRPGFQSSATGWEVPLKEGAFRMRLLLAESFLD